MYDNICGSDECRPILSCVHFEEERCYGTDGHILVIYGEGSKKLAGKSILSDGTEVEGRYPNVDSVFPSKQTMGTAFSIDLKQLREACVYHKKQGDNNVNDSVVINGTGYNIQSLLRVATTLSVVCGDISRVKMYNTDPAKSTVFLAPKTKVLLMPVLYKEEDVDAEREIDGSKVYSNEAFINDYVFNGWKKPEKQEALAWLD